MIDLPAGWRLMTVGEAGRLDLGRQRHPDWHKGPEMRPYLRVANVFEDRIDITDLKEMDFSRVFERFRLHAGDVLLNEGQTPELLGRPAIYRGLPPDVAFTNTLIRFRPHNDVLPEWALAVFRHYMHSGRFKQESRITTNIAHLSLTRLKSVEFPVPPIGQQRRIVEILEDHLSRLEAATRNITAARHRAGAWRRSTLDRLIWSGQANAPIRSVGGLLAEKMRNGHSARVSRLGTGVRALTLTAVTRNSFSDEFTKIVDVDPQRVRDLWLRAGDVLVQRSNTPELVGTTALYQGPDGWAIFPDLLIRLRANEQLISPSYLAAAIRSDRAHRFLRSHARGLAGSMPKIDQSVISSLRIPVPAAPEECVRVVQQVAAVETNYGRLVSEAHAAAERTANLRRSLLEAAFSGRLTGRASDDETVEELAGV